MRQTSMRHKLWLFLFFALGLFVALIGASLSFAQSDTNATTVTSKMTLTPVLQHAYINNPSLMSARSDYKATTELLPQAYSGWKPTIGSTAGISKADITGSNFPGAAGSTSKDVAISVDQPLFRGGRTLAQTSAAEYTIRAQAESLRSLEQDIMLRGATAYMDVLRDQALLELSKNNHDVIAKQLEATEERYEVGELTVTDVSQAKARLARADSGVITARGDLDTSKALFEEIVGMPPLLLEDPALDLNLPETLDEAKIVAENSNPRILSATFAHKSSEDDIDNVYGELLPEVGFSANWNRTFDPQPGIIDRQTTKTIGVSATIPLYQAGAVRSRVRQAKHSANSRYMDILDVKRQVRQAVVSTWADWRASVAEINSREAQVEAAALAQEGVSAEAELGARTILDTLDADQEHLDAQVALVTAKRNEVVARFALLSSLGLLSPEILGFSDYVAPQEPEKEVISLENLKMDVDRLPPNR